MARAALNWSVRDLAKAAQIHRNTVTNIETGRYAGDAATLAAIVGTLKRAGVEFIDENGAAPACGSANDNTKKTRRRAVSCTANRAKMCVDTYWWLLFYETKPMQASCVLLGKH